VVLRQLVARKCGHCWPAGVLGLFYCKEMAVSVDWTACILLAFLLLDTVFLVSASKRGRSDERNQMYDETKPKPLVAGSPSFLIALGLACWCGSHCLSKAPVSLARALGLF